jgi:hypothetical protein
MGGKFQDVKIHTILDCWQIEVNIVEKKTKNIDRAPLWRFTRILLFTNLHMVKVPNLHQIIYYWEICYILGFTQGCDCCSECWF